MFFTYPEWYFLNNVASVGFQSKLHRQYPRRQPSMMWIFVKSFKDELKLYLWTTFNDLFLTTSLIAIDNHLFVCGWIVEQGELNSG